MFVIITNKRIAECAMSVKPHRDTLVLLTIAAVVIVFVLVIVLPSTRRRPSLRFPTVSLPTASCNYVCYGIPRTGNRLGNHLFYFAGVQYVASLTGID